MQMSGYHVLIQPSLSCLWMSPSSIHVFILFALFRLLPVCCLGTMTFGRQNTEADAHEQLGYSTDQGINFIDTVSLYPFLTFPHSQKQLPLLSTN